ncbi:MAG: hypothetical protein RRA94_00960 [Bacteroidota bacterium]|nr:hypothetical protein [Bacteroidota bacterium]
MEEKNLTVEDIERKQKLLNFLFKLFLAVMILIACVFVGWLISFVGYADSLPGCPLGSPAPFGFPLPLFC